MKYIVKNSSLKKIQDREKATGYNSAINFPSYAKVKYADKISAN
jgi:hypothetical protein